MQLSLDKVAGCHPFAALGKLGQKTQATQKKSLMKMH